MRSPSLSPSRKSVCDVLIVLRAPLGEASAPTLRDWRTFGIATTRTTPTSRPQPRHQGSSPRRSASSVFGSFTSPPHRHQVSGDLAVGAAVVEPELARRRAEDDAV